MMTALKNRLLAGNMVGLFVLSYALLFGRGYAAPGASLPATALGTSFLYEGRLASLTGSYDLKFRIFDAASGGTLVSPTTLSYTSVVVDGGEYRVRMDFGANSFSGDQRFLEVSYRTHTTNASAPYSLQPGRQPLEAVPYALSLRPGATVQGNLPTSGAAVTGSTSSAGAFGLRGFSTQSAGVFGQSASAWGVYGRSTSGQGVYGQTDAANTSSVAGVYGKALKTGGVGVIGDAQVGNAWGVYGKTQAGIGVYGAATSGVGLSGYSASGHAGVYGEANGVQSSGVEGKATAEGAAGVYGANDAGRGVWGFTDHGSAGVFGQSNSSSGSGVAGFANQGQGSAGVFGYSTSGVGVWARNTAGGTAIKAEGNAVQSRDKGGWVKAMAYIDPYKAPGQAIVRCFNSQANPTLATTPNCGFSFTYYSLGIYIIDFGFQVDDRFVVVTADYDHDNIVANTTPDAALNANQVWVRTAYSGTNNDTNARFVIIVY